MITKITNYTVSDLESSIRYLLDKAADSQEVRTHALSIVSTTDDKIAAIYDWVKQNFPYVNDPTFAEMFTSPVKVIRDYAAGIPIGGDCDDMAILMTALYRSVGIQSRVVLIDQTGNGLDHAYCEVWSDKLSCWVNADPSSSNIPLGWMVSYHTKITV